MEVEEIDCEGLEKVHQTSMHRAGAASKHIFRHMRGHQLLACFSMSVMTLPGATAFTRMPCGASASAIARVRLLMPPLLALYEAMLGMAVTAFTLLIETIAPPPPCFTIWRAAIWPVYRAANSTQVN